MSKRYKKGNLGYEALQLGLQPEMAKRQRTGSMISKKSTSKKSKPESIKMLVDKEIVKKAEKKWIDYTFSNFMNGSNASSNKDLSPTTYLALNALAPGAATGQRIGKQVSITSVEVKGCIRFLGKESSVASNATSPPSGKAVWIHLVLDRQNDARTTAIDTQNIYYNGIATTQGSGFLLRNPDYMKQYQVLREFRYDLPARPFLKEAVAVSAATLEPDLYSWPELLVHFSFYHKFKKPLKVRYSGATGHIDDIIDNALHVCGGYGVESETDSAPSISYQSRVRYVDI